MYKINRKEVIEILESKGWHQDNILSSCMFSAKGSSIFIGHAFLVYEGHRLDYDVSNFIDCLDTLILSVPKEKQMKNTHYEIYNKVKQLHNIVYEFNNKVGEALQKIEDDVKILARESLSYEKVYEEINNE